MTDPTDLLEALLGHAGRDVFADQFASANCLAPLIDAGWLVPVDVPSAILCAVCDEAHAVEVVRIEGQPQAVCRRTGEMFPVPAAHALCRVDGDAFARSLTEALQLEGDARRLYGLSTVWRLGTRRVDDTRVAFFLTPALDRLDVASAILEVVAQQARAMPCVLIVASDIDALRFLRHRDAVVRLRDLIAIDADGFLRADKAQLLSTILPQAAKSQAPGRPTTQRDRIVPILDELDVEGVVVDGSNAKCRAVRERFKERYPGRHVPVINTVRTAIAAWLASRN